MSNAVKKKVKVLQAKYVEEADSILIVGECEDGKLQHQINSSCFKFGDKDKKIEMEKTADLMVGKTMWMVFDPDLLKRIKSHEKIKY